MQPHLCTVCSRPHDRPGRATCGREPCLTAAAAHVAYKRALAAALADPHVPRCYTCDRPTGKPARFRYCNPCADDKANRDREELLRRKSREASHAAERPCQGPGCTNPVGHPVRPSQPKLYCSSRCASAAEYLRRRKRTDPAPVPCRRCGLSHRPKYRDGVCSACQRVQRIASRRKSLREAVTAKHGDQACTYCASPLTPAVRRLDHVVPVARGGLSTVANCRWACDACNRSKRDRLVSEWSPALETREDLHHAC